MSSRLKRMTTKTCSMYCAFKVFASDCGKITRERSKLDN